MYPSPRGGLFGRDHGLTVYELAILYDVLDVFVGVDACTVVLAAAAIYKVAFTVGRLYAVVSALTVVLVYAPTPYDVVGAAPTLYKVVSPTAGEVVGGAPSDDKVVSP